jgi:hypothetical protein
MAEHPHANGVCLALIEGIGPDSDSESQFRRKPEFARMEYRAAVLDRCARARNKRPHQNFPTV